MATPNIGDTVEYWPPAGSAWTKDPAVPCAAIVVWVESDTELSLMVLDHQASPRGVTAVQLSTSTKLEPEEHASWRPMREGGIKRPDSTSEQMKGEGSEHHSISRRRR